MTTQLCPRELEPIVARAWADPSFKEWLKKEPREALAELGVIVAPGIELCVVEDTPARVHIPLPMPPDFGKLSDADLLTALPPVERAQGAKTCSTGTCYSPCCK